MNPLYDNTLHAGSLPVSGPLEPLMGDIVTAPNERVNEEESITNSSDTEIEDEESAYHPSLHDTEDDETQLNNEDSEQEDDGIHTRQQFIDDNGTEKDTNNSEEGNEAEKDEETEDEASVHSYSEYYEPKDANALSCEERKKMYDELEARVKFLDEDIEDLDDDYPKRNERFALCAGLYKQNTRNPFSHKTMVGSSKHITKQIKKATAGWKPSMAFKLLIFRQCKLEKGSLFDQACDYICCLSAEMKCTEWRVIDLKGFSLHLPKNKRGYRVCYTKCCRTGRSGKKYHAQRENPLQANVLNTMTKILAALKESYSATTHTLDVKRNEPLWTSPKTLQKHFENLMQIFHLSLLVTEFIFQFLEKGEAENLVPFCAKMLKNITQSTTLWDVMEQLCRVFSSTDKRRVHKDIMEKILKNPSEVQSYLQQVADNVNPEHYRDELLTDMNANFKYARDLLWKGKIEHRDMLIVRFYVLNKVYVLPDQVGLLKRRHNTVALQLKEDHRHENLRAQYAPDSIHLETQIERVPEEPSESLDDSISKDAEITVVALQDNNLNLLRSQWNDDANAVPQNGNPMDNKMSAEASGTSDSESEEEESNNNHNPCEDGDEQCGDTCEKTMRVTAATSDEARLVARNTEQNMLPFSHDEDETAFPVGVNHVQCQDNTIDCAAISEPPRKRSCTKQLLQMFTLQKGVTDNDLQKDPMLLKIGLAENVTLFIVYSAVQLLWTTCLRVSRHKVTPIKEEVLNLRFRANTGYTWLPEGVSHRTKEYGILRAGHADFIRHFGHTLQKLNCQLLCDFLTSHGKKDLGRDSESARSYRIDMGLTNHNYEWRQDSRAPFSSFRDRPKIVNIGLLKIFDPALPPNVALLLDSMQLALDDQYRKLNMEPPLNNAFIDELFCKPLREELGCKHFRFPSFTIGLTQLTEEDDLDTGSISTQVQTPIVIAHEDNLNGQEDGNEMSLIFHVCVKAEARYEGKSGHLLRIYVIAYTRRSAEHYAKNEGLLSDLKEQLRMFRDSVDSSYRTLQHVSPELSFNHPEHLFLNDEIIHHDLNIGSEGHTAIQKVLQLRVSYAPEISVSAGATIIRRILKTHGRNKALEAMVLAAYMCFWGKFYFAGLEMLETCPIGSDENIALYMVNIMEKKYGRWSGGKTTRGHPSNLNFREHYTNRETMQKAKDSIDKFLRKVDDTQKLELKDYQALVKDTILDLEGIGEFYGQRILLPATLAGLVTHHVKHATLGYPIQNSGSSYRTIERLQANEEAKSNAPTIYTAIHALRLSPHILHFKKTARLACNFCGIDERPIWAEHIYCEGMVSNNLGRNNAAHTYDYVFRGQSLFWIFKDCLGTYSVKEKKYGDVQWCPLEDFSEHVAQVLETS